MRKRIAIVIGLLWLQPSLADMPRGILPESEPIQTARMSVMFWDVYDATVYAPNGEFSKSEPFALKLHYLMSLDGHDIAERSVEEMRKQGFDNEMKLAAWYSQMADIFPDVQEGNELVGVYRPGKATDFYKNGALIGTIHDPEFGECFFDIWLGQKTSNPEFREQLLGLNER